MNIMIKNKYFMFSWIPLGIWFVALMIGGASYYFFDPIVQYMSSYGYDADMVTFLLYMWTLVIPIVLFGLGIWLWMTMQKESYQEM